ncbi:MAG: tetratricopeptide repeat protein, partial [Bacteroidia bacterium]|nr:tetratricopeptide repeat protein [Bacteroidia bacterium]
YYKKALKLKQELGDKNGMANVYNNIGLLYEDQSDFPTALDYLFTALDLWNGMGDKKGTARSYNNIGIIYEQQKDYKGALGYYLKSLGLWTELNDKAEMANLYNNIALISEGSNNDFMGAIDNYEKSLALGKEVGNMHQLANSYYNIGRLYHLIISGKDSVKEKLTAKYFTNLHPRPGIKEIDLILLDSSLALEKKALDIFTGFNDRENLAKVLQQIGEILQLRGEYEGALYYYRKGASLAKLINARTVLYQGLLDISQNFEKMKKPDSALAYFKLATDLKDSIFNGEKQKEIGHAEAKFEYQKKQAIAEAETKRVLAVEEERRKRQQLYIYASAAGLIMLGFLSFFIAQRLRITRRQKTIIEKQKENLDRAFSQLEEAKKLVDEKHKDLTDSIQYASRIQNALLTTKTYLDRHLAEYFILFKPRDIVSGDFYWALEHNGLFYLACCDCTGHGVPGAFMSLLNITFLHQAVIEKGIAQPDKIFNNIRSNLVEALNPDGSTDTKDGMDAVLCAINFEKSMISAACANNPMWIIRNGELMEFKSDKLPIGESDITRSFTLHETKIYKGDCVYMFTDGFSDQFGGINGKKFKQAQLKELLLSIHRQPMKEQHTILNDTISRWRGTLDQVDDICVMGVRI